MPEQRRAAAEDVLDDEHPLRAAEPAERGLRGLVGLRDPAVDPHVRDPVGVVDVAQRPGQHRLGQVEAPAAVGGQGGVAAPSSRPSSSNPTRHWAWKPCRLPVIVMSWVRFSRSRTGRPVSVAPSAAIAAKPVRLHLLAAEPAAHPQALHGDLVAAQPEHVGDDLLGLRRVLGAALHEDLPALVDVGQRAVGLEVEVLLAGRSRRRR